MRERELKMNKKDVIVEISKKTGMSQKDTEKVLTSFFEVVGDALADQKKIQIVGFGSFESKAHAARMGKNPKTGDPIEIAAYKAPVFKAGKQLKEKINV